MSPVRFGPNDLLEYNAKYGVIVCRECQYAIQKSALQSHLLRHKIFRHERHRLLSLIAQLAILEPDEVPLPPPTSKPIDALPIIDGFRCVVGECDSLFASAKRMRRHQLESHGISTVDVSEIPMRAVTLQTFFRGTKIKYFQVNSVDSATTSESELALEDIEDTNIFKDDECEEEEDLRMKGVAPVSVPPSTLSIGGPDFDLQSLVYFSHFLSMTSCSMPLPDSKQPDYWQTEFVNQSLQQKWLMAGLLALSASHMGAMAHQASTASRHYDRSAALWKAFEDGRKEQTQGIFNTSLQGKPTPREGILEQIDSMLTCAHLMFSVKATGRQATLERVVACLRGFNSVNIMLKPKHFIQSNEDAFGRAARMPNEEDVDPVAIAFLRRLEMLPGRMAEALDRPDDLRDGATALSAISTLIESCVAYFEADDDCFWVMAAWLSGLADDFHQMLAQDNPAALVVLAHWAAGLVARAEEDGCWFLDGAARFILAQVQERLPGRSEIETLIEGLEV